MDLSLISGVDFDSYFQAQMPKVTSAFSDGSDPLIVGTEEKAHLEQYSIRL